MGLPPPTPPDAGNPTRAAGGWRAPAKPMGMALPGALSRRLYLRIWLAVVLAITVVALLAGWLWRLDVEREREQRPGREIVIYNAQGNELGRAPARPVRRGGHGPIEFQVNMADGEALVVQLPRPGGMRPKGAPPAPPNEPLGFVAMLVLVSLVPNLVPLITTAGLMGYLGVAIKPSTLLVFSIAFGIAVDDAIHYLSKYRMELKATNHNIKRSVLLALRSLIDQK